MMKIMLQVAMRLTFRLWLTITETSPARLSTSFYYINSSLNQILESYNHSLPSYNQDREKSESKGNEFSSQLEAVRKRNIVKVAIVHNRAFWVRDNKFWTSRVVDGYIDDVGAEEIDAYSLSKKEFSMLLDILDGLNS